MILLSFPFVLGSVHKYVGGEAGGLLQIFHKKIQSPGDHRPKYFIFVIFSENISWSFHQL